MPADQEPSEEEIAAGFAAFHADTLEDVVIEPPIQVSGQSDVDYDQAMKDHEDLKKRYAFRAEQIARWLNYRRPARDPARKEPEALDRLLAKLSGVALPSRRKLPAFTVWAQAHPEIVEPLIKKRILELQEAQRVAGGEGSSDKASVEGSAANSTDAGTSAASVSGGSVATEAQQETKDADGELVVLEKKGKFIKKGKSAYVAVRQEVIRNAFNKLDPKTCQTWAETARTQATQKESEYIAAIKAPPPTDPASRQSAIERIPSFVQPVLDGMSEATGWSFTLLAGGPEPADGGRLNIISCHSGVTLGPKPLNFGAAAREGYKKYVIPLYANFLQRSYTVDECRRRAMPAGAPTLASIINEEADGVCLDTIVLPPKLPPGINTFPGSSKPKPYNAFTAPLPSVSATSSSSKTGTTQFPSHAAPSTTSGAPPPRKSAPTTARMKPGPQPPLPPTRPSSTLPASSQKSVHTGTTSTSISTQRSDPAPKDRSARYRLAGSGRVSTTTTTTIPSGSKDKHVTANRPRSASSPPSPSRPSNESPKPTPPRATRSPTRLSPITISSSPVVAAKGSGRPNSPINLDEEPTPTPLGPPLVIRTYKSPSRKRGRRQQVEQQDTQHVEETMSDEDVEMLDAVPDPKPDGYESDSVFYNAPAPSSSKPSKRRAVAQSISEPGKSRQAKKPRIESTISAPGPAAPKPKLSSLAPRKSKGASASAPPPPPPPPGSSTSYDVPTPPEAPDYVVRTLELARANGITEETRRLLRLYLRIDGAANFQGDGRLPSYRRPDCIGAWIARARAPKYRPDMSDLAGFYEDFLVWFKFCMPEWRKDEGKGIRLTRNPNGDWESLRITGRNGIVSFIPVVFWWWHALQSCPADTPRERQVKTLRVGQYEGVVDELIYCFTGLARNL
ncbi:SERTA domain-containing protein 3 [Paramarasmius palmivorus]|uniref:SERTA domain-containing protein 3 n=1 Tax=Paramarasmius palmivorus TaxID=297713 RepID=A0AAW0AUC9_9AGAR